MRIRDESIPVDISGPVLTVGTLWLDVGVTVGDGSIEGVKVDPDSGCVVECGVEICEGIGVSSVV